MKKNTKKWILIIIAIIGILLFSILFYFKQSNLIKKYNINLELCDLSTISLAYTEDGKYNIELLKSSTSNSVYGTIIDASSNNNLFLTIGIFEYNTLNNKFNYYENNSKTRIMDFNIINNVIYKVLLENNSDGKGYTWKFVKQNLKNNMETEIDTGEIINIFEFPKIMDEGGNFYLSAIKNYKDDTGEYVSQKFMLYKVNEDKIGELLMESGSLVKDYGNLAYNLSNVKIYNNKFYYTIVDENHIQYFKSYDLKYNKNSIVYQNNDSDYVIYNYIPTDNGYYLNLSNKYDDNKAKILYFLKNGNEVKLETKLNTFEQLINKNNILFHNSGNKWIIYDISKNKLHNVGMKQMQIYPKYLVLEQNEIIIQDFDNNFYIGKISD